MTIAQQLKVKDFPLIIKDSKGKYIYFETSDGFWYKNEYDTNGNRIYFEDSNGYIINNHPKSVELSMDDIASKFGVSVSQLKIKK